MDTTHLFIEPVDALFLRGNRLFGDPGSFGEALIPPWPSVAAGAIRSALLAHRGYDPARFARGEIAGDAELGAPARPGTLAITCFQLARRSADGAVEPLYGFPADLSITGDAVGSGAGRTGGDDGHCEVRRLRPHKPPVGVRTSAATRHLAVLAEPRRSKPLAGHWLTSSGWRHYLDGGAIAPEHVVKTDDLWRLDTRIGIALDPVKRRASTGALFTSQGIVFRKREHGGNSAGGAGAGHDVGFLAGVAGAALPDAMTLRLGGDGRAAVAEQEKAVRAPDVDYARIAEAGRCRLILTTPGLFEGGWRPTGVTGAGRELRFDLHGVQARVVCAAVPRSEVVSGFDLAERRPKPAQRAAPAGAVYWLDDLDATAAALRKLAVRGLWSDPAENVVRWAEGFNRFTFGTY